MSDFVDERPPILFWFIGAVALIWNLFGFSVYYMTVTATPETLAAAYTPEQVAFIGSTPVWATSVFALSVTTGVLACVFLLLRKSLATPLFIVSLVAILVQNINSFVLMDAVEMFGTTPVYIQTVVVLFAVFLIFYSRHATSKRWIS